MAKALVVVESPAKAKTINKYLGRNYKVVASMGHVRDLPENPKWKLLNEPDTMLVHVVLPKAEEVAAPAEGEAAPAVVPM